ncbi:hypothetical protein [Bifidobacterium hapali]|uniref:hypothetical protein n=1 Tax=Bifidobacterium hapali TaxID=1630172 RepID=UPI001303BA24|nr:hypothetical protein [Bifidobacterium hapali]
MHTSGSTACHDIPSLTISNRFELVKSNRFVGDAHETRLNLQDELSTKSTEG